MAIPLITAPHLSSIPDLLHGFTTRMGGVSPPPYDSLNLARESGDLQKNVQINFERLADQVGISRTTFRFLRQIHGADVVPVGSEKVLDDVWPEGDAMITLESNVVLAIRVADCFPIVVVDERHHAIGISHAGWRGTLARVLTNTIRAMQARFQSDPKDLKIAIGPGIGPKKLEVSAEIATLFSDQFQIGHSLFLDLAAINTRLALDLGVPKEQIWSSGLCTHLEPRLFFSYRRDGESSGRMIAYVGWSS